MVRKRCATPRLGVKFEGVSGPIACNEHGQCAQFKPAVYEFTNGDPKTFKIGENPKKNLALSASAADRRIERCNSTARGAVSAIGADL